jgi:hypothetical protein
MKSIPMANALASVQRVEQCFGFNQIPGCETFGAS